jgi:hypothetical protein
MALLTRRRVPALMAAAVLASTLWLVDLRYLVWRHLPWNERAYTERALSDSDFRGSFIGRPRSYLSRWIADLRPGKGRRHVCPDIPEWAAANEDQDRGEWIGDTPWLVVYDSDGTVRAITMPKGC